MHVETLPTSAPGQARGPPAAPGARTPREVMRRATGPLLGYHVLILVGAFFTIRGSVIGSSLSLGLGIAMIVAGIGTEIGLLAWSAGLTRSSAVRDPANHLPPIETLPARPLWRCIACGQVTEGLGGTCPTCGRPLIRASSGRVGT